MFCNSIASAKILVNKLIDDDYSVGIIYGKGMEREERDKIIKDFRDGVSNILVSTNLISRGIDISSVNFVVNWDIPRKKINDGFEIDWECYEHRKGRAGRFGKKRILLNLIEKINENEKYSQEIIKKENCEIIEEDKIQEVCDEMKKWTIDK